MAIQSLSILVPCNGHCWNNCRFCVSQMHDEHYSKDIITTNNIPQSYLNRMQWTRDAGCDSLIFTGVTEPQQNLPFIYKLLTLNRTLRTPFYNISIQTTGTALTPGEIERLAQAGINTIALSISSFSDQENWDIIQAPKKVRTMSIADIMGCAKDNGMNVRACLNLTSEFNAVSPWIYFDWAEQYDVDQLTFRKIYSSGNNEKSTWIREHLFDNDRFESIRQFIIEHGTIVRRLPFGALLYDVNGISTVIDEDCMAEHNIEEIRYAVLRANNHLYSSWNKKGSLIF